MIEATEPTFDQLVKTSGTVLVEFSASWCGPCQTMRKVLAEFTSVDVLVVDVNRCPNLTKRFAVSSVPTLILLRNGSEAKRHVGTMNLTMLQSFIS